MRRGRKKRSIGLRVIAAVAIGFGVIAAAGLSYSAYRYDRDLRIDAASGIDEAMYVPIGGIDQWIQIRGQNRDNPVLLWLNGGPGFSTIPMTYLHRSWEKPFTVVMWDQRGEGKTFARSGTSVAGTMTIERMAQDGIAVTEYLRQHLHKDKVILLGHSWGSILGIHMAKLRPDLFAAYVGTGQVVDLERDAEAAYPLLLDRARALHNEQAERELEAAGPPPYDDSPKKWVWLKWANALDLRPRPRPSAGTPWALAKAVVLRPPYLSAGVEFSQSLLWPAMLADDLPKLGLTFGLPMVFVQGDEDRLTVTALAKDYLDSITAPAKDFVRLPGVGHLAVIFAPDAFLAALIDHVLPLAAGR
jgi:pimeloyl-ACP methyl ester carboxylesterase